MPSYINGIDASLIVGLGQIGVGSGSAPVTYPTGGLIANTGFFNNNSGAVFPINGITPPAPPWYNRPLYGSGVSSASVWTKIASSAATGTVYLLSSSGELFSAGATYSYTGRPLVGFVAGRIDKVTGVTPTSSWTDISVGGVYAIGINDGYLWATGQNSVGQWGSGSTTLTNLGGWTQVSTNQGWHRVEASTANYTLFMSGSGGSGSVWSAGLNNNGRTGQNVGSGNTLNRAELFGATGSIFTDMCAGGNATTLLITSSAIWGCGINSNYNLGDGTTTQRLTIRSLYSGSTMTSVYAFPNFSKAISSESYHFHTGNTNNSRGDGSDSNLLVWTRVNTTGDLASGWQKFYGTTPSVYGTCIGVKNNRPYHIKSALNIYAAASPAANRPWNDAVYEPGSTPIGTWVPFISGSANANITCSACDFTAYNALTSPYQPAIWMYLTPH